MELKGILFDMDGVLLDSEEYICQAGVEMYREKGHRVDPEAFLEFTGMGENRYLGGVAEKYGIPFDLEKDKARTYEIYEKLVRGKLKAYQGVRAFIQACLDRGLKIAVASSADPTKVMINLKEIGIPAHTFGAVVTGLDVIHKKPAPDVFLEAASRLGLDPAHCLVIEDAVSGVAAGKAAGSKVLALTTSFSAEQLQAADFIAPGLWQVPPAIFTW